MALLDPASTPVELLKSRRRPFRRSTYIQQQSNPPPFECSVLNFLCAQSAVLRRRLRLQHTLYLVTVGSLCNQSNASRLLFPFASGHIRLLVPFLLPPPPPPSHLVALSIP